jgi:hypothetical protein
MNHQKQAASFTSLLLIVGLAFLWVGLGLVQGPATVQAQNQAVYVQMLKFTGTVSNQYISIPNRSQTAHTVQIQWATSAGGCAVELDGSGDGTNFVAIASGNFIPNAGSEALIANGYFTAIRIKIFGSAICSTVPHTGVYTGYQYPLPVGNIATISTYQNAGTNNNTAQLSSSGGPVNAISAFQCYNTNNTLAYLQIFNATAPGVVGSGFVYQVPIPGSTLFSYIGPKIVGSNTFFIGAATAAGGAVGVTDAVACVFEQDFSGPWAPLLLPSP